MSRPEYFAEVILPLSLAKSYTYRIPENLVENLKEGHRVLVQFGKKKFYSAIIFRISNEKPGSYQPKDIISVLDDKPLVGPKQLALWSWISQYYVSSLGDVMQAGLPAGFKLSSESRILLHPDFQSDFSILSDKEYLVAEALLSQKELSIGEIQQITGQRTVYHLVKSLIDKNVVFLEEELSQGYRPKIEQFVSLNPEYKKKKKRKELFDSLSIKAPKQMEILLHYYDLRNQDQHVSRGLLMKASGKNYASLNALIKKGILEVSDRQVSRLVNGQESKGVKQIKLADFQIKALQEIRESFNNHTVTLLQGVTGSGKTEIYCKIINEYLDKGEQVLYLLPEIALTSQMISRLKKYYGDEVGVYHSRFSNNEQVEIWNHVNKGKYKVILGARSSLFLPFTNLRLIVVDEEHDTSYKQFDPAPRYSARDTAIYMAGLYDAKVILGSATPSMESYKNALTNKYGKVIITQRYGDIKMPKIEIADITRSRTLRNFKSQFGDVLLREMKEVLAEKQQIILFRNRRGYSPYQECSQCGHIPYCENCDVALTYHKFRDELKCHYCNYTRPVLRQCPACGNHDIIFKGFGTQKVADEVKAFFPEAKVARMDYDAVRTKFSHQKIINDFEIGKIDVLVGTQMVTKGLDFDKVALVGILSADHLLHFPDFRSSERAFQLMVQVSGRSGRKKHQGKVIIQARDLQHKILRYVVNNKMDEFYADELSQRKGFLYPPYVRMINLLLKDKNKSKVHRGARRLAYLLKSPKGVRVYPPISPIIEKVRGFYLQEITIKMERNDKIINSFKRDIQYAIGSLISEKDFNSVRINVDVDPY